MKEQKKSKKKMSTAKKVVLGFFGVALIVGATIAGTMAFLRTTTGTPKENVFTSSKDIVLGLDEPNWNWDDDTASPKEDDKPNPGNFQPGITYDKDPFLANITPKNGTELAEEWVAMRVDYYIESTEVTYTNLTTDDTNAGYTSGKAGIIDEISTDSNWYQIPNGIITTINSGTPKYDIFIYKYKLKAEEDKTSMSSFSGVITGSTGNTANTSKLFTSITTKSQDQLITNGWKNGEDLKLPESFTIKVKGAAIKHDSGITATEIVTDDIANSSTNTDSYKIAKELVELLKP